jgi:hypothetical protein
MQNV